MRDSLLLYINGKRCLIRGVEAFLPLAVYLREHQALTGTKQTCGEGECGACIVLVGETATHSDGKTRLRYRTINACLHRVFQMDCCHIVTVEGVNGEGEMPGPTQRALIEHFGTQCGYCTPGMVMALTAVAESQIRDADHPNEEASGMPDLSVALSGNLCRCTGYLPILEAGQNLLANTLPPKASLFDRYPADAILDEFVPHRIAGVILRPNDDGMAAHPLLLHAASLREALDFLAANPDAIIMAGGTGRLLPETIARRAILSIASLQELARIELRDEALFVGATATWTQLGDRLTALPFPALEQLTTRFGSPQIRNRATLGGSVVRRDPNGDLLPLLLVQDAVVHLAAARDGQLEHRSLPFADFLAEGTAPSELVTGITIPLPATDERLETYKVSRRRAFDRSVFCAAVRFQLRESDNLIVAARVACGGIGMVPLRLPRTEAFLNGTFYTEKEMRRAGEIAAAEIKPGTDAYAGAEYRQQLVAHLLLRFFHDSHGKRLPD
jgi:xanthine dehydrogenase small subunit